tara:strand:+ start:210449 stop:210835 length:387 start_codon:yes stop_codon:yes gene_type:complete
MTKEHEILYNQFKENNKLNYKTLTSLSIGDELVDITNGYPITYLYGGYSLISDSYTHLISKDNVESVKVVYKTLTGKYYRCTNELELLFVKRIIADKKLKKIKKEIEDIDGYMDVFTIFNETPVKINQ